MPVKNASPWLSTCLWSIVRQTFTDWECIVVDDHSSDDSWAIAAAFCEDSRFHQTKNRGEGIVDALNTALAKASGEFITRMDADDIMPPEKLELLYKESGEQTDLIVTGKVRYFSIDPVSSGYRSYEDWLNKRVDNDDHWKSICRECVVASANWMTHRDNIPTLPDRYPEDYHLVFDWYRKELMVKGIKEVTHYWREHARRTSRLSENYAQPAFFDLKIERFLALDRTTDRPLVVLGKNQKSKLIEQRLQAVSESYHVLDQGSANDISKFQRPQILVAVYPSDSERKAIEDWLATHDLVEGSDWWWC